MSRSGYTDDSNQKVVYFSGSTRLDIPVDRVLEGAEEADLQALVLVGVDKEGREYIAASCADPAKTVWLLERAKFVFLANEERHQIKLDNEGETQ